MQNTKKCGLKIGYYPVMCASPAAEAPQDILIARPEARRTMGLPDLVLPINLTFLVWVCILLSQMLGATRRCSSLSDNELNRRALVRTLACSACHEIF